MVDQVVLGGRLHEGVDCFVVDLNVGILVRVKFHGFRDAHDEQLRTNLLVAKTPVTSPAPHRVHGTPKALGDLGDGSPRLFVLLGTRRVYGLEVLGFHCLPLIPVL